MNIYYSINRSIKEISNSLEWYFCVRKHNFGGLGRLVNMYLCIIIRGAANIKCSMYVAPQPQKVVFSDTKIPFEAV